MRRRRVDARPWRFRVLVSAAGLALLAVVMMRVALPTLHPAASDGEYGVGTATYAWTDTSRAEIFPSRTGVPRRLMAQVWYPTPEHTGSSPYIDDSQVPGAVARAQGRPPLLGFLRLLRSDARPGAAPLSGRHPVLLYLTGLTGFRQASMFQVEALASRGYVVIGLDQPGMSATTLFPDGQRIDGLSRTAAQPLIDQSTRPTSQVPSINGTLLPQGVIGYLVDDVRFALDQIADLNADDPQGRLTGMFDLQRVGVFGISLGGITAAEACRVEPRLKACLIMDAPMTVLVAQHGLRQPALWLTRPPDVMRAERHQTGGWAETDIRLHRETMTAAYLASRRAWFVDIDGIFHLDFTDAPFGSPVIDALYSGPIGGRRAHEVVNTCTIQFFDFSLQNKPSALLSTGDTRGLPEVTIKAHH